MARAALKKKPPPEVEFFDEVEQGSPDWYELRLGTPTASCAAMVLRDADAKTRVEYMRKLAGELMTGKPAEGKIVTAAMQRGNDMEPLAREHYERSYLITVERVGFVRRRLPSGRFVGCSPDGLLSRRSRGLEIKTVAPHLLIPLLEPTASIPSEHLAQVRWTQWVCDLDAVDLLLFYEGMPPRSFTVKRNEAAIAEVAAAAEVFDHELHRLYAKLRGML